MKTILITGCSSGFGLEIAKHFLGRDWKVIATMRSPRTDVLPTSDRLHVLALDVTDPDSIQRAVETAGPIDDHVVLLRRRIERIAVGPGPRCEIAFFSEQTGTPCS